MQIAGKKRNPAAGCQKRKKKEPDLEKTSPPTSKRPRRPGPKSGGSCRRTLISLLQLSRVVALWFREESKGLSPRVLGIRGAPADLVKNKTSEGLCSRVSDLPATYYATDGNPDIRVPETIDKKDGQRAQRALKEDAVAAGNPDIQVPENVKSENGLRAGHAVKEEDAEGITAKSAEREASGENQKTTDPYLGRKKHRTPEITPRRDRKVPRNSSSAASLEGRG
ncbi:hypothetical protein NDU88_004443 [Pleurodeles waltl]|uniref:Uncharacterized protein n=1 Tax=Pleurodeles waltl TaxID=8319 RepID=A0AAV7NTQ5_PLEWA|nr:hypothetical protein NDU88_004443 [Pleurodeles waltl]